MSSYTAQHFEWRALPSGLREVLTPFEFWYFKKGRKYTVHVPVGTVFDGASIPWLIRKILGFDPFDPEWVKACIVHDVLVGQFGWLVYVLDEDGREIHPSWFGAASIFNRALKVKSEGLSNRKRRLLVFGVRAWGVLSFKFI